MNFLKIAFFFTITFLFQDSAHAQDWVSYQSQQQVNDLVDTGNELLMATDAGLVVLNKSTLEKTIFNKANSNLSNNHIQSITQSPDGQTWVGTYDLILARFDGSDFQDAIIPEGIYNPLTIKLYDIEVAPNGHLWVGTSEGVFRKQGQDWTKYDEIDLGEFFFEVWDIELDSAGDVFIGAQDGVHKFENGVWSNISSATSLVAGYLHAELFFSASGDLYFAGDLDSIGRYDGDNWELYGNGGLNGSQIKGFTEDVEGSVYFNFQDFYSQGNSIFKLENNAWMPYTDIQIETYGYNSSYYHIDDQNIRWLNNNIYLSANDNGSISSTSISSTSIEYDNVHDIHKGHNGDMFFIMNTSTNSIAVVDPDGNWSSFELPSNIYGWGYTGDILFLAADDVWLASPYDGLYHYDGNEWSLNELEGCNRFAIDSQGKIYVAATDRIYIVENGIVSEYNTSNSPILALEIISGLGVDANDNLWIASFSWDGDNAIQKVAPDGNWTTYSDDDHPVIIRPEGDFHFDINGNVWVSAGIAGVIKFDGQDFTNPIQENISNLENYKAYSIESDSEGRMYFSHQYGVTTLLDGEWKELFIDDVPPVSTSYSTSIKFDDAGTLWWASRAYGVFSYIPETTTATFSDFETEPDFSIYPNPADSYTVLDFTIKKRANVTACVYNNLGQLISSLDLGQLSKGTFQQTINLADFPNGFYSIRLQINDLSYTKKMIINN
jgi:ligand-binding sensor domain-containing protein